MFKLGVILCFCYILVGEDFGLVKGRFWLKATFVKLYFYLVLVKGMLRFGLGVSFDCDRA